MSVIFTSQTYSKKRSDNKDSNYYLYWLTVDLQSQSVANNTSTILVSLYMAAQTGSGTLMWNIPGGNAPTSSITVEGTTYPSTENVGNSSANLWIDDGDIRRYARSSTGKVIAQKTLTIIHDNNGQKFISVSFKWTAGTTVPQYYPITFTSNGATVELPAIARSGSLDMPGTVLLDGSTFVAGIGIRSYADYYYDLSYTLDGHTVNALTKQRINNTSYLVSINSTWLIANCSKAQANLVCTLTTYADAGGNTQIGDAVSKATVVMVDTTYYKPSITFTESIDSTPIVGYLVAGFSTMALAYSTTMATGANFASVSFTTTYGSFASYDATQSSGTVYTNTLPPTTASGVNIGFTATVVDSRGATYTYAPGRVYAIWPYDVPTITATAFRVATSGSTTADGAGLYVYLNGAASTAYDVDGQNTVQSISVKQGSTVYSNPDWASQNADASKTYTFIATDNVSSSTTNVKVGFALYSLDLYDDGSAAHLGVAMAGPLAEADKIKLGNASITEVNMMNSVHRFLADRVALAGATPSANMIKLGNAGITKVDMMNAVFEWFANGTMVNYIDGNATDADTLLPHNGSEYQVGGMLVAFTSSNSGRTNWPATTQRGILLAIALSGGTGAYAVQFCYMNASNYLYMRYKSTTWQTWKKITFS